MRVLEINKRPITYKLLNGETEEVDAKGYKTGRHILTYTEPATIYENYNVSDRSEFTPYGIQSRTRVTITLSKDYGWDKQTILSINGEKYIVKSINKSPNGIMVNADYAD